MFVHCLRISRGWGEVVAFGLRWELGGDGETFFRLLRDGVSSPGVVFGEGWLRYVVALGETDERQLGGAVSLL